MNLPPSILLVDDHAELLNNLSFTLEAAGYQTIAAKDGFEALNALQSCQIDLILSDIEMPRMNGYQLYQGVRKNPKWTSIPFLFLTAHALDATINFEKLGKPTAYLTKPIRTKDLLTIVQDALQQN